MIKFNLKQRPKCMKQKQVVQDSGMRQQHISEIENGNHCPSLNDYERYLNACGKTLSIKKLKKE